MKRLISLTVALTLLLITPLTAWAEVIGKFTYIKGRVDVTAPGEAAIAAKVGDEIEVSDIIRAKSDSKAEITFTDGHVLRVAPQSRVGIQEFTTTPEKTQATLKLFRGKIKNSLKHSGRAFGRLQKNRFEVHTPIAVVGVRGSTFDTYHRPIENISGAVFTEGHGYGFAVGRPDEVVNIGTGKTMIVRDPDQLPELRDATEEEMSDPETAIEENGEEQDDQEQTEGEAAEEEATDEEEAAEDEETAEEDEIAEEEAAEDEAPAEEEPTDEPTDEPADEPTDEPADESTDGGGEKLTGGGDFFEIEPLPPPDPFEPPTLPIVPPPPYIPPPTEDPPDTSNDFVPPSGLTFDMVSGTYYEDDLDGYRDSTKYADYWYEYFIYDSDNDTVEDKIIFGVREYGYYANDAGTDWFKVYLPDGISASATESNDFEVLQRGTWTPGQYAASFFSDPGDTTSSWQTKVYYHYEELATYGLHKNGGFSGSQNSSWDIWPTTVCDINPQATTFSGKYTPQDPAATDKSLFDLWVKSPADNNIAYIGFYTGILTPPDDADGSITGQVKALYIDNTTSPDNNAGIFGSVPGNGVIDFASFNATTGSYDWSNTNNSLAGTPKALVSTAPADLLANLDVGTMHGWYNGDFGAANTKIFSDLGWGATLAIKNQDWGIFKLVFGIDNGIIPSGTAFSGWASGMADFGTIATSTGRKPNFGIWQAAMGGDLNSPVAGAMDPSFSSGKFMTLTQKGTLTGTGLGVYDANTWMAEITGEWKDTVNLHFNGVMDSKIHNSYNNKIRKFITSDHRTTDAAADNGEFYEYQAYKNTSAGWSWHYEGNDVVLPDSTTGHVVTKTVYNPDGTTETWRFQLLDASPDVNPDQCTNNEFLDYSKGAYTLNTVQTTIETNITLPGDLTWNAATLDSGFQGIGDFGDHDILLGGTADLWTSTSVSGDNFELLGSFGTWDDHGYQASVYSTGINSYNPYYNDWTIMDPSNNANRNGAYYGYLTGRGKADATTDGNIRALYIDSSNNLGIIMSNSFTGTINLDGEDDLLDATGLMFPVEIFEDTGLAQTGLYPAIDGGYIWESHQTLDSLNSTGYFLDGTHNNTGATFTVKARDVHRAVLMGQSWGDSTRSIGVISALHGGTYSGTPTEHWLHSFDHLDLSDPDDTTLSYTDGTSDQVMIRGDRYSCTTDAETTGGWSGGLIDGYQNSAWVNLDTMLTGIAAGEIKGTFDVDNLTWEMATQLVSMDVQTFMDMADNTITDGQDKLKQLKIPAVQVGTATLIQTGGAVNGITSLTLNNVTFYSHAAAGIARLFASNNVTGNTDGSTVVGAGPTVSGGGLSADTFIKTWATNTWSMAINNGTGTITRSDGGPTSITFRGVAGGTIDSATTFSGTATGVAGVPPGP